MVLVGYWFYFAQYERPEDYYETHAVNAEPDSIYEDNFEPWSKNANPGHDFDVWLLNQFPRPEGDVYEFNRGGYLTLNFIPSIATMLLGSLLWSIRNEQPQQSLEADHVVAGGAVCMVLGLLAGEYACPIVKRIWTPSWVLFSGAYVIWMLALFYLLFDVLPLRWLAFPLVVVGMNSITMYILGQLMRPWSARMFRIHFGRAVESWLGTNCMADDMLGRIIEPTTAFSFFG